MNLSTMIKGDPAMTRRTFISSAALVFNAGAQTRSKLGIATTCYLTVRRFNDTLQFLEHANSIGAAGIQTALTSLEPAYLDKVERRLKDTGMYLEVMSPLPRADMARFIETMEAAKRLGALCVRSACLGGRRYETFNSLEDWKKFVADSKAALTRAVPVAEKTRLPFVIENHKDWTVEELAGILKSYESEYFGVCLDTGNNIALIDDPMEVVERLAPYAVSTHIKDMGVNEYEDGFLLSEVPIGQGMLDIPKIISIIERARPKTRMTLEMITRDPLKVPVFTDKYWATFPDRDGAYLARTLRMVRSKKSALPVISGLSKEEQLRVEEQNVRRCLQSS
jgi:sugar phosphate isomerase/epimerase